MIMHTKKRTTSPPSKGRSQNKPSLIISEK